MRCATPAKAAKTCCGSSRSYLNPFEMLLRTLNDSLASAANHRIRKRSCHSKSKSCKTSAPRTREPSPSNSSAASTPPPRPNLERELGPVLARCGKDLMFDLAGLKFISSAGLRVFLHRPQAAQGARRPGILHQHAAADHRGFRDHQGTSRASAFLPMKRSSTPTWRHARKWSRKVSNKSFQTKTIIRRCWEDSSRPPAPGSTS